MKFTSTIGLLISAVLVSPNAASDCKDVIALSRTTSVIVQDKSQVVASANTFCSQNDSSAGSSGSTDFGAAYKFLSLSLGQASATREEVASRFCKASNRSLAVDDAYRQHVEEIAPGAYSSFVRCEELQAGGIVFSIDSVLPTTIAIGVSLTSKISDDKQTLDFVASPGVSCTWIGKVKSGKPTTLKNGQSVELSCSRDDATTQSSVTVFSLTKAETRFVFPWRSEVTLPSEVLQTLQNRITSLERRPRFDGAYTLYDKPGTDGKTGPINPITGSQSCPTASEEVDIGEYMGQPGSPLAGIRGVLKICISPR